MAGKSEPAVEFNHPVRHIRLTGLQDAQRESIHREWEALINSGAFFRLVMAGRGRFECLVQEDRADDFLEALGFPDERAPEDYAVRRVLAGIFVTSAVGNGVKLAGDDFEDRLVAAATVKQLRGLVLEVERLTDNDDVIAFLSGHGVTL